MKESKNKSINDTKYYTIQKGKNENGYFLVFPSILISSNRIIRWDTTVRSIYIGWARYFLQYNIYETIKQPNLDIEKKDLQSLFYYILKPEKMSLINDPNNIKDLTEYLNKNPFLISLIKNGNLEHHYNKKLIASYFKDQPFIVQN